MVAVLLPEKRASRQAIQWKSAATQVAGESRSRRLCKTRTYLLLPTGLTVLIVTGILTS
jgi:hypothetical protein